MLEWKRISRDNKRRIPGQDKTGQDSTAQDRTGHDVTGTEGDIPQEMSLGQNFISKTQSENVRSQKLGQKCPNTDSSVRVYDAKGW